MKNILIILASAFMLASCNNSQKKESETETQPGTENTKATAYICPMDCEKGKTYVEPGKCPVCSMDLEKKN